MLPVLPFILVPLAINDEVASVKVIEDAPEFTVVKLIVVHLAA